VPGEKAVGGPAEVTLRYAPPAGSRLVCPATYETTVSAVGIDRPIRQTLGGEREDVDFVEAIEGGKWTVRRRFGETKWTTAYPLPAPETRDLPPAESVVTIDETGRVESGTADPSIALAMAVWVRQLDMIPGWPQTPLRPGDSVPRPLLGPGPPGTSSTLEAAAPLKLVGFAEVAGRTCAKFRSDVSGWLRFQPPDDPQGEVPARSALHGTGWLCFDIETGALLGAAHALHYALPLPGPTRPAAIPEFDVRMSSGPCTYEPGDGPGS
jgi:hypothetical protein